MTTDISTILNTLLDAACLPDLGTKPSILSVHNERLADVPLVHLLTLGRSRMPFIDIPEALLHGHTSNTDDAFI